ncbi:MAG: dipeptidase PepE [Pyrinomonadaceae bacterium]
MRLLLISNSTLHGSGYLDHAASEIQDFLGEVKRVLFVPFALHDEAKYAAQARARFEKMGYELESIHAEPLIGTPRALRAQGPRLTRGLLPRPDSKAVREAEAIFIGGGNTFRLLKALYDHDLLDAIRERVREGMPYIGSSAGSNVAALTIRTTNDMPIVQPPSLDALGLVRFQINPHYLDADPNSTHKGETREERIIQFLEENETPVVGLREGAMLRIENGKTLLKGSTGARIFRRGHEPVETLPGDYLDELLS